MVNRNPIPSNPLSYRLKIPHPIESYETSGRLRTADVLKGILILGIVFVHIFMLNE